MHMKKFLFAFCSLCIGLMFSSCASDGCSIVGTWAVSDIKMESTKFSESMIEMMETEYKNTTYVFNEDGTMSITTSNGVPAPGTYTFTAASYELKWEDDANKIPNVLKVLNCTGASIELSQRMPADEAQELTAQVTMTLVPKK